MAVLGMNLKLQHNLPSGTRHAQSTAVYDNALWYMCGIASNNAWKIINTTTVGVPETLGPNVPTLKLYPNPALEQVTLMFPSSTGETNTIQIYNLVGSLVYEMKMLANNSTGTTTINISEFTSGVFFIKINNQPTMTSKFIKL